VQAQVWLCYHCMLNMTLLQHTYTSLSQTPPLQCIAAKQDKSLVMFAGCRRTSKYSHVSTRECPTGAQHMSMHAQ
jgi:hypothetical protein